MPENTKVQTDDWVTVLEYDIDEDRSCHGSQTIDSDGVHVYWACKYQGKVFHSISTTLCNEEQAKLFFYTELRGKLRGSWLIMRTLIEKEAKVFHDKMKVIEDQIPAALLAKYQDILGPLEAISQAKMDETVIELRDICDGWRSR